MSSLSYRKHPHLKNSTGGKGDDNSLFSPLKENSESQKPLTSFPKSKSEQQIRVIAIQSLHGENPMLGTISMTENLSSPRPIQKPPAEQGRAWTAVGGTLTRNLSYKVTLIQFGGTVQMTTLSPPSAHNCAALWDGVAACPKSVTVMSGSHCMDRAVPAALVWADALEAAVQGA